jgi:hypothetical protein
LAALGTPSQERERDGYAPGAHTGYSRRIGQRPDQVDDERQDTNDEKLGIHVSTDRLNLYRSSNNKGQRGLCQVTCRGEFNIRYRRQTNVDLPCPDGRFPRAPE